MAVAYRVPLRTARPTTRVPATQAPVPAPQAPQATQAPQAPQATQAPVPAPQAPQAPQVCPVCESCPPPAAPETWSSPTAEIHEAASRIRAYYARDPQLATLLSSFAATRFRRVGRSVEVDGQADTVRLTFTVTRDRNDTYLKTRSGQVMLPRYSPTPTPVAPTPLPTFAPTFAPTVAPTPRPTLAPTATLSRARASR